MSKVIKLDPKNFNKHTESGMELLEKSIKEVGVIESVTIDANGEVITGNARQETFEKLGYTPKFIELGENEYPVIQTNLDGKKRVKAAILANTVAQKNINLNTDLIQEIAVEDYKIDLQEVGVEIIDINIYNPNIHPQTNRNQISEQDIQRAQIREESKFDFIKQKTVNCICPHCGEEFEIKVD